MVQYHTGGVKGITHVDNQAEVFEQIVLRYQDTLVHIAYQYLKDIHEAQDIAQTAFIKLAVHADGFPDEEYRRAWLIRVVINLCKDELRSAKRKTLSFDQLDPFYAAAPDADASNGSVLDAVMRLTANYRNVVYLHYYAGYSLQEIAQALGKNANTVQSWHRRAKGKLHKLLDSNI